MEDQVPATHKIQLERLAASDAEDHVPGRHEVHDEDPAVDQVPMLHEMQVEAEIDGIVEDHMPAAHDVQEEDPIEAHDPALHAIHVAADVAPVLPEACPAAQVMQTDLEVAGAVEDHVPALQAKHTGTILSHVPAEQELEHITEPGADTELLGQDMQTIFEVAAIAVENVPALH